MKKTLKRTCAVALAIAATTGVVGVENFTKNTENATATYAEVVKPTEKTNKVLRIGKYLTTLIVLLNSSLFFLLPNNGRIISRFYKLFLIPHYYYSYNAYSNLYVETICSILLIMIILTSLSIIIKIILKKKRDI